MEHQRSKRSRDNSGSESAAPPPLHPDLVSQADCSTAVKDHHRILHNLVVKYGGDVDRAWQEVIQDEELLGRYSQAMQTLGTKYWVEGGEEVNEDVDRDASGMLLGGNDARPPSEGKEKSVQKVNTSPPKGHDDRIQYTLECLKDYFIGSECSANNNVGAGKKVAESDVGLSTATTVHPKLISLPLKMLKRSHFITHQCAMTRDEEEAAVQSIKETTLAPYYYREAPPSSSFSLPPSVSLSLLDVGSCYHPFSGCRLTENTDLEVTALDLGPYPGSGVFKADWLAIQWDPSATVPTENKSTTTQLVQLPPNTFDAAVFCLLLSYMPTSRQRVKSCIQAYRALKPYGLLVVISTRTQGPRNGDWIPGWVKVMETIGFGRVDKHVRKQIVGLSFRKLPRQCATGSAAPTADRGRPFCGEFGISATEELTLLDAVGNSMIIGADIL